MKRKFTFLIAAALMLLTMMATTGTMWGQTRATVTDHMTASNLAATGTSYTAFSNVSLTSDAVYAGRSALNNNTNIQLRSSGSNCGIVTTTSGGKIKSITITVASGSNKIDVYGKNSAYTNAEQLYNSNNQGTKLGTVTSTGTITVTDDYEYVGIRSYNGAVYISSIDFVWDTGGSSNLEDSNLAITNQSTDLVFDLYNNAEAQVINYTTSSTGAVTVSASDYVTTSVNETAKTITVTPTAVTPSPQTITVSQTADATYSAGSVTFTVTITNTPPAFTVTLGDDSSTLTEASSGAGVTLPTRSSLNGYDFAGWSETNVNPETTTAPTIIAAGEYHPTANITLYPVYSKTIGGGGSQNANASVTIADYATAHNWGSSSSTNQKSITLNSDVTATCNSGTNSGKYYNDGWRIYQTETGKITITTTNGTLTSVTFTFTVSNTGTLNYNSSAITSGTAVNVSGTSAEFTVGNSGSATNGQVRITAISVNYTIQGSGTTYYWSYPVAATVETPAIVIAENPFYFSTTATITCATEGAAIKYSFDGANWSSYSAALTITETTTIYAKAIKDEIESTTAYITATKNLAVPTVTIDATNITNTDVFTSTAAGSLSASITYNEVAIEGATVTWSGDADAVATIDASTGAVTLVAAGSVTFTATYAGNGDYSEKTATYQMTVINTDPNIPGSQNNPYTVAQARAAIDAGTGVTGVYATGIVSEIVTEYSTQWSNITFDIVDESGDAVSLRAYRCGGDDAANVQVNDIAVIYGNLTQYGEIYEFASGCQLVSLEHPIVTEPTITVTPATVNVSAEGEEGTLTVTYDNINEVVAEVYFCDAQGGTATYDWITAEINSDKNVYYIIDANDGEARTAYLKVYALDDNAENVYSNLVTINQDEYVAPTYATLPFSFDGGKADIEDTDGLSQEGLGGDYGSSPKLKFDGTGDWLLLQFDERPGTLTFDIKGNTFSGGTFTVQTSENGETYTDLATYTELGSTTQSESFDNLGENVRYIKWIYTNKDAGNVALGNIALAAYQEQVATPTFTPAAGEYSEAQSVTIACETAEATIYYTTDGSDPTASSTLYETAIPVATTTTIKAIAIKEGMSNSDIATATYTINIPVLTASITVYPLNIEATAAETVDWLAITLENIDITEDGGGEFDLVFCDNDGNPLSEKPAWFEFDFSFNDVWSMPYTILANTETTARTLYFKIYGLGDDGETEAYSDLVTVTQAGYVVDYAELPFEWEGGASADLLALTGVSASQLSGDYASGHAPYLIKFDNTGKYIQVKTDSQPGVVTIGVKMIGGDNTSTITVQGSVDGETFDDGEALEISGNQNDIVNLTSTRTFGENVRYVKLYFTKGSNVGVGPITIAPVDNTPSVSLNSYSIEATSVATNGSLTATYNNIETVVAGVAYYESDGTTTTTYNWFTATINATDNTSVDYVIAENDDEERTAYFKVYATVNDENIYSELVTVTQAAYIPPVPTTTYTLATSIESGLHYIITNGTNKAMGVQNNNNRAAVAITIENYATTITEDAGVYEIVINGPDANGKYTIYDKQYPGYLYAASSSSNHLKTRESNSDGDSQWTIEFETAGNVIITATGNNTRNLMRYNNGSTCFSCYDTNNSQQNIYLYVKENDTDYEYYGMTMTYTEPTIPAGETLTVGAGSVMTVPDNFQNNDAGALIIGDGGQLIHPSDVQATVQKSVAAYTAKDGDGWYLIASPVDELSTSGLITEPATSYDLFAYNEATAYWWSNTGGHDFSTLSRGQGYLYANANNIDLDFAGLMIGTETEVTKTLSFAYDGGGDLKGYNLMGNPFSRNLGEGDITLGGEDVTSVLLLNNDSEYQTCNFAAGGVIKPGQGFFIQATDGDKLELKFNPSSTKDANEIGIISIKAGDENYIDKAYIQFGGGNTLRKMTFSGDKSQVYVMHHHEDYAAATIYELEGSVPVHFVPVEDGFYTITIETKNIENLNYMHLIDNITNTDIDLLAEPSYTFKASESDNADRFHLVFDFNNYTGVNENYTNDNFAHQIGDEIFVSGEGTLQVFDVLGRFVTGYNVNGDKRISTAEFNTGVYIFRMVGTEVKTQKIVIR